MRAVNLYAFDYLAGQRRPASIFYDLTQIGIEVAVRQLGRKKFKGRVRTVRKDLVIWPTPGMTLRKANAVPNRTLPVMEVYNETIGGHGVGDRSATPSTAPAWTAKPMIRRVYLSMTTRIQWGSSTWPTRAWSRTLTACKADISPAIPTGHIMC